MSQAERRRWLHTPLRVTRLTAHPLDLPLAAPLVTGRGRHQQRETLLVEAEVHAAGRSGTGWGEAALLSGWNQGQYPDFIENLTKTSLPIDLNSIFELDSIAPSICEWTALRAGAEGAILDALARACGCSLADLLAAHRATDALGDVPVQRTLGSAGLETSRSAMAEAAYDGFTTVKLKVGAESPTDDLDRVTRLAHAFPDLEFRLDANGAWDLATACRMLARLPVALIEQPVAPTEFDALLARYGRRKADAITIAADESCSSMESARALIDAGHVGALVVKPVTLGGTLPALELIEQALATGIAVIISNLMESAVGRGHAAALAAACPELSGAHGLATGAWLAADLVDPAERIERGRLMLPNATAGLGFVPRLPHS